MRKKGVSSVLSDSAESTTPASIDARVLAAEAEGFRVVQQGRVLRKGQHGLVFADRVEGLSAGLLRSGDVLLDDEERWVHMQRSGA